MSVAFLLRTCVYCVMGTTPMCCFRIVFSLTLKNKFFILFKVETHQISQCVDPKPKNLDYA